MKYNLLLKTSLILSLTLILSCCENDDRSSNQLPEATQIGANTVGCLVNGNIFLPHAEGINPEVNCFYQYDNGEFYFILTFSDLRGVNNETVSIQTGRVNLQTGETYILNKNHNDNGFDFTGGGGTYFKLISNQYNTNIIKTGELTITRVDLSNSIISGTFWFDAINEEGEVVEIREGRFDWDY